MLFRSATHAVAVLRITLAQYLLDLAYYNIRKQTPLSSVLDKIPSGLSVQKTLGAVGASVSSVVKTFFSSFSAQLIGAELTASSSEQAASSPSAATGSEPPADPATPMPTLDATPTILSAKQLMMFPLEFPTDDSETLETDATGMIIGELLADLASIQKILLKKEYEETIAANKMFELILDKARHELPHYIARVQSEINHLRIDARAECAAASRVRKKKAIGDTLIKQGQSLNQEAKCLLLSQQLQSTKIGAKGSVAAVAPDAPAPEAVSASGSGIAASLNSAPGLSKKLKNHPQGQRLSAAPRG